MRTQGPEHECPECGHRHTPEAIVMVRAKRNVSHPQDSTVILAGQVLRLRESHVKKLGKHVEETDEEPTTDVGALLMRHTVAGSLVDMGDLT